MNDGGPAFPRLYPRSDSDGTQGMSLRDYFAGQALLGFLAANVKARDDDPFTADNFAHASYDLADAMIREREKTQS